MPFAAFWPPEGNPTPATPAGSWNPTWLDDVCHHVLLRRARGVAALAEVLLRRLLGRAEERAGQCRALHVLPPLSRATIACVDEDAGKCHTVPPTGTDVPTGASAIIPLPSAPKLPVHVQPTVGPTSISAPVRSL